MRSSTVLLLLAVVLAGATFAVAGATDFASLEGPYLGQDPPGATRELFAPGILSDGLFNGLIFFSESGDEVLFSSGFEKPFYMSILFHAQMVDGGWSEPSEIQVSVAASGNLYFQAGYHIDEDEDIWFAEYEDGRYRAPVQLGDTVNSTEGHEVHPVIASDESYLLFDASREAGYGLHDLYVSFPDGQGGWTPARNLGPAVNTAGDERRASVSNDGKYLFFESKVPDAASRLPEPPMTLGQMRDFLAGPGNGGSDFYRVDALVIEKLRPERTAAAPR